MMKFKGVRKLWNKYACVAAAVLIGIVLLLLPSGKEDTKTAVQQSRERDIQTELEEILSTISGVGQVKVLLTEETDGERLLAQDTELTYSGETSAPEDYSRRSEAVLVDGDSGEQTVTLQRRYPTWRGALVVCQGGDRPEVQLTVTQAVSVLTGLSSDRVTVAKWQ